MVNHRILHGETLKAIEVTVPIGMSAADQLHAAASALADAWGYDNDLLIWGVSSALNPFTDDEILVTVTVH